MSWLAGMFGTPFDGGTSLWQMPQDSMSLTALQGEMTFGRMAATLIGGGIQSMEAFAAASQADETIQREAQASWERARDIRLQTLDVMSSQAVGFAASGVDPSSGSALHLMDDAYRRGKRALDIERENARLRMMRAGWLAAQYRSRGQNLLIGAGMMAGNQFGDYAMSVARRG